MERYKFAIEAYFTKDNFLEIEEQEKELFKVEGKSVILKSIGRGAIKNSEGIKIECGMFNDLGSCIDLAKKVYANFLLRLNISDISYFLDKASRGNFCEYCKDSDANIYKEIIIIDTLKKKDDIYAILECVGHGCTHFKFNKLLNISLDKKIKNSLLINNYRKYLKSKELNSRVDNTLISASIEMLIDKIEREEKEQKVIKEVCDYLEEKYRNTRLIEYKNIKQMVENNKHKSIRSLKKELIKKYSTDDDVKKYIELIETLSTNRTSEIHTCQSEKKEHIWADQLLFDIQFGYMKDLCNKINK